MSKEKIDLKSIKKLNTSGKPVKKGVSKSNNNNWKHKGAVNSAKNKGASSKSSNKNSNLKANKSQSKPQVKIATPEEWLYFSEYEDGLLRLKNTCMNVYGMDTQYWDELGVIEVSSKEGAMQYDFSMDIEELEKGELDEELKAYCEKNNIQFVAVVTLRCEDYETAKQTLRKLQDNAGGVFCLDNGTSFKKLV